VPAPQYCPSPRELDDLELLLNGGLAPLRTFQDDGPVRLERPTELAGADPIELVDPEGLPLARLAGSQLTALSAASHGPFRRLHLSPDQVRTLHPGALTVPVAGPLTTLDLAAISDVRADRPVVLLALTGTGTPQGLSSVGLLRATLAAARILGDAHVVAVPLASHGDAQVDHELGQQVVANFAPGDVLAVTGEGDLPTPVAEVRDQDQPHERGVVVFFTGLSGSGKSTLAQALNDRVLESGERTVTSLDGDVVRRHLSAGLGFSREDRETNILRIGWVAAEISRHRGIAICSPIAPFDATRRQVRAMVESAGGEFVLVHVATPLEECERRDRKGLYARARAGEIPDFTGISSPYEAPEDATVRVDTTGRTIQETLADVLVVLPFELDLPSGSGEH
jgi:sulfate adenylyltransferase